MPLNVPRPCPTRCLWCIWYLPLCSVFMQPANRIPLVACFTWVGWVRAFSYTWPVGVSVRKEFQYRNGFLRTTASSLTAEWCHRAWWRRRGRCEPKILFSIPLRLALGFPCGPRCKLLSSSRVSEHAFPQHSLAFSCIYSSRVPAVSSSSHIKLIVSSPQVIGFI